MRTRKPRHSLLAVWFSAWGLVAALAVSAVAASPADPVRDRFVPDFQGALDAYQRLGQEAMSQAQQGLAPLPERWRQEMRTADALLVQYEHVFFPMMNRPWTREAAVFSNLEGARMWLWSIHDGLRDGAAGVESIDVAEGRVRAELLENFSGYLSKAAALMEGGEFKGSYFEDTLVPILADYCAYPEDGKRVKPEFDDERIFDDVRAKAAVPGKGSS